MHDPNKPLTIIIGGYPRGQREINGLYYKRFGPLDTAKWFEDHGVKLKVEADGRVFPTTDKWETFTILSTSFHFDIVYHMLTDHKQL